MGLSRLFPPSASAPARRAVSSPQGLPPPPAVPWPVPPYPHRCLVLGSLLFAAVWLLNRFCGPREDSALAGSGQVGLAGSGASGREEAPLATEQTPAITSSWSCAA